MKLTLKDNVPSVYSGWYTTQDGTVKHTGPYAGVNIKTVAESSGNGTPTIVECYATKDKPGLSVNKTIHLINGNTNVSSVQTVNVNDMIVYKIEVENTRNVTLSDINVSDTLTKDSTSGSSLTLYSDETCTTEFPELSLWLLMPAKHCMPNTP